MFSLVMKNMMAIEALKVDTRDSGFIWVRVISENLITNLEGNGSSITEERGYKHLTNCERHQ